MKKLIARLKELLFQNRSTKQTVVKNVFWLSFGQISSRLIRALVIIYAARVLGAETYGVFSYALGLAGFFTIFADIGINGILTREVAQKPHEAKSYFATSFAIKATLLIGTAILVIFVAPFFSKIEAAQVLIPLVALLVIFDNVRDFCNSFFRAKDKMEREALVTIITNVAIAIFGFFILSLSRTAYAITVTYIASAGIGMAVAVMLLKREFLSLARSFKKSLIKPLLRSAWPIALTGLLGAFMINVDIIMLGKMRPAADIGFYAAGQRIVQMLYLLPAIFASAIFPTLSRLASTNETDREISILEKTLTLVLAVTLPIVAGGIALGKPIIAILYGSTYLPGTLAFQILIVTLLLIFPGTLLGNTLVAHDRQKKAALPMAIAAISNIILNILFIPLYGIVGAAIATLIVQTLYITTLWRVTGIANPLRVFNRIHKIIVATVGMSIFAIILETFHVPVLINIPISGLLYAGILLAIKEPLVKEIISMFSKAFQTSS